MKPEEIRKWNIGILIVTCIRLMTVTVLTMAGCFVYRKTKFNNKFIISMICLIFFGLSIEFSKYVIYFIKIPDQEDWSDLKLTGESINIWSGEFMHFGLVINLRIWMSYLFKI